MTSRYWKNIGTEVKNTMKVKILQLFLIEIIYISSSMKNNWYKNDFVFIKIMICFVLVEMFDKKISLNLICVVFTTLPVF